jgi:hypothetical protein
MLPERATYGNHNLQYHSIRYDSLALACIPLPSLLRTKSRNCPGVDLLRQLLNLFTLFQQY